MVEAGSNSNRFMIICIGLILLCVICMLVYDMNNHFIEYLHGFWVGNTIDGQCIIYLDNGHMRLIEINEILETSSMNKCKYKLSSHSLVGTSIRKYKFNVDALNSNSKIAKKLNQTDLYLDLYPIEGTCIIYDNKGDILTLMKDNKANLELLI